MMSSLLGAFCYHDKPADRNRLGEESCQSILVRRAGREAQSMVIEACGRGFAHCGGSKHTLRRSDWEKLQKPAPHDILLEAGLIS